MSFEKRDPRVPSKILAIYYGQECEILRHPVSMIKLCRAFFQHSLFAGRAFFQSLTFCACEGEIRKFEALKMTGIFDRGESIRLFYSLTTDAVVPLLFCLRLS